MNEDLLQQLEAISEAVSKGEMDPEIAEQLVNELTGGLDGMKMGDDRRAQAYKEAVGYADGGWLGGLFKGVPRDRAARIDGAVDRAVAPAPTPMQPVPAQEERITPTLADIMSDMRAKNPPIVCYADGGQVMPGGTDDQIAIIAQMVQNGELDPEIAEELISEAQGGSVLGGLAGGALGGYGGAKLGAMAAPGGLMGKAIGAGLGALAGGLGGYNAGPAAAGAAGATAAALSPAGRAFLGKAAPKIGGMGQEAAGVAGRTGEVISGLASQGMARAAGPVGRTGDAISGLASQGMTSAKNAMNVLPADPLSAGPGARIGAMSGFNPSIPAKPGTMFPNASKQASLMPNSLGTEASLAARGVLDPLGRKVGDMTGQAAHNIGLGIGAAKNKADDLLGMTKTKSGELLDTAAEKLGSAYGATVQGAKNVGTKLEEAGKKAVEAARNPRETGQQGLAKVLAGIEEAKLTSTLNKSMNKMKAANYRAPKLTVPKENALLDAVRGKESSPELLKIARQMLAADSNLEPAKVVEFLLPRV